MTSMLEALKFVQGAVAKKDFLPAMTHFAIQDGHVRAFNGRLALSSPIEFSIDCKPKATSLVQAIGRCNEDQPVTLSLTEAGRLRVQNGSFKVYVPCDTEGEDNHMMPQGEVTQIDGQSLIEALKVVAPFMGTDASRPWSNAVLFTGQSCFATNNVCIIERWLTSPMPFRTCLSSDAVKEILRIGEPPYAIQASENSISFLYEDGKWVYSQLLVDGWPDVSGMLDSMDTSSLEPMDERVFQGLESIAPFVDAEGRVIFSRDKIRTHFDPEEGASFDVPGFFHEGCYNHTMLSLLKRVAQHINLGAYPSPCVFQGEMLRGAIVGMRL